MACGKTKSLGPGKNPPKHNVFKALVTDSDPPNRDIRVVCVPALLEDDYVEVLASGPPPPDPARLLNTAVMSLVTETVKVLAANHVVPHHKTIVITTTSVSCIKAALRELYTQVAKMVDLRRLSRPNLQDFVTELRGLISTVDASVVDSNSLPTYIKFTDAAMVAARVGVSAGAGAGLDAGAGTDSGLSRLLAARVLQVTVLTSSSSSRREMSVSDLVALHKEGHSGTQIFVELTTSLDRYRAGTVFCLVDIHSTGLGCPLPGSDFTEDTMSIRGPFVCGAESENAGLFAAFINTFLSPLPSAPRLLVPAPAPQGPSPAPPPLLGGTAFNSVTT